MEAFARSASGQFQEVSRHDSGMMDIIHPELLGAAAQTSSAVDCGAISVWGLPCLPSPLPLQGHAVLSFAAVYRLLLLLWQAG